MSADSARLVSEGSAPPPPTAALSSVRAVAARAAGRAYGRVPASAEQYASFEEGGATAPVFAATRSGRGVLSGVSRGKLVAGGMLFSAVLATGIALGSTLRPSPSSGGGDDACAYDGYRLQPLATPSSYRIRWRPDFGEPFGFNGSVAIDLTLTAAVSCLQLHADGLTVSGATVSVMGAAGAPGAPAPVSVLRYDLPNQRVVLGLGGTYPAGARLLLSMGFNSTLRDDMTGLYRSSYKNDAGATVHMVATQFEATYARRAWPSFDEPAYKAVFNVSVDNVPPGYTALGNMPVASESANPDGTRVVTFQSLPRLSTYLVALVVAPLVGVSGVTPSGLNVTAYAVDRANNTARLTFARDVGVAVLPYYESIFKLRFPLPKMDSECSRLAAASSVGGASSGSRATPTHPFLPSRPSPSPLPLLCSGGNPRLCGGRHGEPGLGDVPRDGAAGAAQRVDAVGAAARVRRGGARAGAPVVRRPRHDGLVERAVPQ